MQNACVKETSEGPCLLIGQVRRSDTVLAGKNEHGRLYGDAPSYLVDLITPSAAASVRAGLRSAESMTVAVPRTLSSFGDRSFATAGPHAWNKLPSHLRLMKSADTFRRHLKTIFFFTRPFYHDIVRRPCCAPALT